MIYWRLHELYYYIGDHAASLVAIDKACEIGNDQERSSRLAWVQCTYFPQFQQDAFDNAFQYGKFGYYQFVDGLPAYKDYLARRQTLACPTLRWSDRRQPEQQADIAAAESRVGVLLPSEYARFLSEKGRSTLILYNGEETNFLHFEGLSTLAKRQGDYAKLVSEGDPDGTEEYFQTEHSLTLRHLIPVAKVAGVFRSLVIYVGSGERNGWCFDNYDDDAMWEPDVGWPSFDAMIEAIEADPVKFFER
jgi:hypothetical protein